MIGLKKMKVSMEKLKEKCREDGWDIQLFEIHVEKLVLESLDEEGYLLPIWFKYPDIPAYSIGWRMGHGEDYMELNRKYYQCLAPDEKLFYRKKYPSPPLPKQLNNT